MSREVLIGLTPEVASRLEGLSKTADVWIVRTPETERAAERVRSHPSSSSQSGEASITLFNGSGNPEDDLAWVIDETELHHGLASDPASPVSVIRVIGTGPTSRVRSVLATYNFTDIESEPDGFVARWMGPV